MRTNRTVEWTQNFIFVSISVFLSSYYLLHDAKEQVFYVSAALALIPIIYNYKKSLIKLDIFFILVMLFLIYFVLSTYWSTEPGKYFSQTFRHSLYIIIGLVYFRWGLDNEFDKKLLWLFLIIILSAFVSMFMTAWFYPELIINSKRLTHMSFMGLSGNPIHTGLYFGVASLISLFLYRKSEKKLSTSVFFFLWISLFVFLFLTKSRGAVLFYFIAFFMVTFSTGAVSRKRDHVLYTVLFLGTVLTLAVFLERITGRIEAPNYRLELLQSSWEVIKQHLWVGSGLNHDDFLIIEGGRSFTKVHNSFVHALQVGGILGFIITIAMTLYTFIIGIRSQNEMIRFVTAWFVYGCFVLAIDGELMIDRPSREWFCYWIPLFIIYTGYYAKKDEKEA